MRTKEDRLFKCSHCHQIFARKCTEEDISYIKCPVLCSKGTVTEVTKEWEELNKKRRQERVQRENTAKEKRIELSGYEAGDDKIFERIAKRK